MITIPVALPDAAYDISIEPGLLERLGSIVAPVTRSGSVLLAMDAAVVETHGARAAASLRSAGLTVVETTLVATETDKSLDTVHRLYDTMLAARLERGSVVVAVGGGIVGDTAGFAASTYLRGIACVQVPTTLLAMVDAAIGGKTGVNIELPGGDGLGKNLVGAFWQPAAVVIDPEVLATLDARQFRCGLAECVKHGILADADLLAWIENVASALLDGDVDVRTELIARSVAVKAAVVAADEREAGGRAALNLGHTFAHAIESRHDLGLYHGEAVSIGLCAAANVAAATGRLEATDVTRIRDLLTRLGLPVRIDGDADASQLLDTMRYDKKVAGGRIRLVLPRGLGATDLTDDIADDVILDAWHAVNAR